MALRPEWGVLRGTLGLVEGVEVKARRGGAPVPLVVGGTPMFAPVD